MNNNDFVEVYLEQEDCDVVAPFGRLNTRFISMIYNDIYRFQNGLFLAIKVTQESGFDDDMRYGLYIKSDLEEQK